MAKRTPHHYYDPGSNNGNTNSNGYQSNGYSYGEESEPMFAQNDELVDGLRSKVGVLKSLTLDMGDEIKSQNQLLRNMDNEFDSSWGLLSTSMARVKKLAASGQNKFILYLVSFSCFVFFFIYLIIRFR